MFRILALACVLACVASQEARDDIWAAYKLKFQKAYGPSDDIVRRTIFEDALSKIHRHNMLADLGVRSYWQGLSKFTDLTAEEYKAKTSCYKSGGRAIDIPTHEAPLGGERPKRVDWRKKGYVTPVKDQGDCGSCWAFSTTGTLEGQHFAQTKKLVSLSEQNLVDCSDAEGDEGCSGGWPVWAQTYVLKNKGIDTEKSYPYVAMDQDCKFKKSGIGAKITGFKKVAAMSESALEDAIAKVGPISVCIDASQPSFASYKRGVYDEPDCSSTELDHCVLAAGYDVDSGKDYYIVKNSWGEDWGNKGYIWMSRNKDNQCGISTNASYPLV